jgi:hypothetical protein
MRGYLLAANVALAALFTLALTDTVFGQDFVLQVGPPIAGNAPPAKGSMFVVRPGGCANPGSARITATAEGIVNGSRRSVPLTLAALPTPGVHAIPKEWPNGGVWIVSVVGTCAGKTAAAIVPIGPRSTFQRETVKLLGHRPTAEEVETSLKALTPGGQK